MCVIEPFPIVETRRLALRSPGVGDIPRLVELANDPGVARMTLRMPHPYGTSDAEGFIAAVDAQDPRRDRTFVIAHEDHGMVGVIGLFEAGDVAPEVGYWIGRAFWGRGYATEALQGAMAWAARDWRRRVLTSGHFTDNPASGRVLEKAGFLYTGEVRRAVSRARAAETETRRMIWIA